MAAPTIPDASARFRLRSPDRLSRLDPGAGRDHRRRADIQGLRAVAVLLVVTFHAGLPVPGGFMGVDVFFAISGFVITSMLLAELESSGRIDFPRFYVRRARRLLPALALMLSVVLLLGALLSPAVTQHMTALTGMAASVFAANVYLFNLGTGYFDVSTALNPLLHTWTLAVEEQFYLVFPALLLLGWLLRRRVRGSSSSRAAAALVLGIATVGSLVLYLELSAGWSTGAPGSPERVAFYGSPTRGWEFGAGALLALAAPWAARMSGLAVRVGTAVGLAAIALAAFTTREVWVVPGAAALLPVLGTCAMIAAGTAGPRAGSRLLIARPVVWIGDLSYSWYLWHWPLIVFAKALWPSFGLAAPIAAGFSLVPAWLSFRFVENPIRRGVRVPGKAFTAFALACILLPVAAGFGLLGVKNALAAKSSMGSWTRSRALHADFLRGCDNPYPLEERKGGFCVWTVPDSRGEIVLVGDSNAGHFTEPVVRAARGAKFNLTVVTFSSCPFLDVGTVRPDAREGEALCRRFSEETLAALVRLKPSLVITAARSDEYIEDASMRLRDSEGRLTNRPQEKARVWEQALESTLAELSDAGVPVLVVQPVPMFPQAPDECTTLSILTHGCATSLPRSTVDASLRSAKTAERKAVVRVENAFAIDFEDEICAKARCSTSRDDTILYRDRDHLSVDGALTLADGFYRAIIEHARAGDTPAG